MSTYTLKSVVRRGTMLGLAVALGLATVLPAASTFADALNPLTERSLTLSSGSPGWNYTDASGNPTYAPPNSGANGQKTGNTFSFRVSSNAAVKGLSFQYCTKAAGDCKGPGDNGNASGSAATHDAVRKTNAAALADKTSDLEIVGAGSEIDNAFYGAHFNATAGQPSSTGVNNYDPDTTHPNMPALDGSNGTFLVLYKNTVGANWTQSTGWTMATDINQTQGGDGTPAVEGDGNSTNKKNYITLANTAGTPVLPAGAYVKVIFFATNNTYITNPGSAEFFVKINTYNSDSTLDESTRIDGGVTVANVMNRSIEIQTKVLETMQFSVGTVDPNTLTKAQLATATGATDHTPCDPIAQGMTLNPANPNVLQLGNSGNEFSLETGTTYSTHSYWRLSSNSSGGATVYYSGVTLSNTVGDQIRAIGKEAKTPTKGGEQFGLALDNGAGAAGQYEVSYAKEREATHLYQNGADNDAASNVDQSTLDDTAGNLSWHTPRLYPLAPVVDAPNNIDYGKGTGVVNIVAGNPFGYADNTSAAYAKFAFDPDSNVIPTPIASGNQVLDCTTGKMRYIANIAATTPAGIYTTKINYIAAPKY